MVLIETSSRYFFTMKSKLQSLRAKTTIIFLMLCTFFLSASVAAEDVKYGGMCNASAAEALDGQHFIVADDEDNTLRIYDRNETVKPFQTVPLAKMFPGEIQDGEDREIDLEGAAVLRGTIFWIGSHSTSKKGKFRQARHRLFALEIKPGADGKFVTTPVGQIYTSLVADLEKDSRFNKYAFHRAKGIKPKDRGGLNIEGLASSPEGVLLIGFRNPLSGGKVEKDKLVGGQALLVPLLNPLEVIEGKTAKFGDPIDLDLDGYGIRSIELLSDKKFLVVAGSYHEKVEAENKGHGQSRLYLWSSDKPQRIKNIDLGDLNIEAAFFYPQKGDLSVQLLSDDGKLKCEDSFRSRTEILEIQ
jgi:Protein of unknown function (DUF3616)